MLEGLVEKDFFEGYKAIKLQDKAKILRPFIAISKNIFIKQINFIGCLKNQTIKRKRRITDHEIENKKS